MHLAWLQPRSGTTKTRGTLWIILAIIFILVLALVFSGCSKTDAYLGLADATPTLKSPLPTTPPCPSITPLPTATATAVLHDLTLEDIFHERPVLPNELDPQRLRTLIATGDVIPARFVDIQIRAHGNDFSYPFAETAKVLRSADVTLVSLEAPLISNCPVHREGYVFCGQAGSRSRRGSLRLAPQT